MSTTNLIIILAVAAIFAIALLGRSGGPRVTHIETRRTKDGDDDA